MRIAFDYTAAASHWPGVGRYGRELVRALVRRADCPELLLFQHGRAAPLPAAALGLEAAAAGRVERLRIPGPGRFWRWRARLGLGGIESHLGAVALVHRAFGERPPVRGLPSVLPVFELPAAGAADAAAALGRQTRLVVGSQAGRRELLGAAWPGGLENGRVVAVTTGADHWLRDAEPLGVDALLRAGPPRLLVLGAIDHRRRPLEVLRGFEALVARQPRGECARLHFDGRPGDAAVELERALKGSPAASLVTWNRRPEEAQLPALVAGTTALVHLSRGELSPVTPLEALHFGASVLASKLAAFEELLGGQALGLVDAEVESDPSALAGAMAVALAAGLDPAARVARRQLAAPFTWDACAIDHLTLWRELGQSPV